MNQCNEMLRDANSLDQNGRQLVIAFMTGNKCEFTREEAIASADA